LRRHGNEFRKKLSSWADSVWVGLSCPTPFDFDLAVENDQRKLERHRIRGEAAGFIMREHERDARAYIARAAVRALRARYFPRPVRKRARESATASSNTRSSAPKALSRSLSTLSTPRSREANFIEISTLERVSASATSSGPFLSALEGC
jgi:sRNA-binding protein